MMEKLKQAYVLVVGQRAGQIFGWILEDVEVPSGKQFFLGSEAGAGLWQGPPGPPPQSPIRAEGKPCWPLLWAEFPGGTQARRAPC